MIMNIIQLPNKFQIQKITVDHARKRSSGWGRQRGRKESGSDSVKAEFSQSVESRFRNRNRQD